MRGLASHVTLMERIKRVKLGSRNSTAKASLRIRASVVRKRFVHGVVLF